MMVMVGTVEVAKEELCAVTEIETALHAAGREAWVTLRSCSLAHQRMVCIHLSDHVAPSWVWLHIRWRRRHDLMHFLRRAKSGEAEAAAAAAAAIMLHAYRVHAEAIVGW